MTDRRWLCAGLLLFLAGCATKPAAPPASETVLAEPQRQYMCVSKIFISDASRAYSLSGQLDGDAFAVPVGQWMNDRIRKVFWQDSTVKAGGRPQPTLAVGFAQGTGARPALRGDNAEVQVVLQFQILWPTGQAYNDIVAGRAAAQDTGQAAGAALVDAVQELERILLNAGVCRQVQ